MIRQRRGPPRTSHVRHRRPLDLVALCRPANLLAYNADHIYDKAGSVPGLSHGVLAAAQSIVQVAAAGSDGQTKVYVGDLTTACKRLFSLCRVAHRRRCAPDEMGIYRCTHINYTTVLDRFPARYLFHNPRAAWFAAAYGQLAAVGVEAMGSSQYFGYDSSTGARLNWPHGLQTSICPCLSMLGKCATALVPALPNLNEATAAQTGTPACRTLATMRSRC